MTNLEALSTITSLFFEISTIFVEVNIFTFFFFNSCKRCFLDKVSIPIATSGNISTIITSLLSAKRLAVSQPTNPPPPTIIFLFSNFTSPLSTSSYRYTKPLTGGQGSIGLEPVAIITTSGFSSKTSCFSAFFL